MPIPYAMHPSEHALPVERSARRYGLWLGCWNQQLGPAASHSVSALANHFIVRNQVAHLRSLIQVPVPRNRKPDPRNPIRTSARKAETGRIHNPTGSLGCRHTFPKRRFPAWGSLRFLRACRAPVPGGRQPARSNYPAGVHRQFPLVGDATDRTQPR